MLILNTGNTLPGRKKEGNPDPLEKEEGEQGVTLETSEDRNLKPSWREALAAQSKYILTGDRISSYQVGYFHSTLEAFPFFFLLV